MSSIENDSLQRFMFEKTAVRGEIVRLHNSYQTILQQQTYNEYVGNWLGEALCAAALLSATIKFDGVLIFQVQGDGPLKTLLAHSDNELHIRGLAQTRSEKIPANFATAVGKGHLVITLKTNEGPGYQGVVDLSTKSLATAVEDYFHQSEQLATFLFLAADGNCAAGLLLQNMPMQTDTLYDNFWDHITQLAQTLTATELLSLPNQTLLHRLYHEEDILLFEQEHISFRCTCSPEKCEVALKAVPADEIQELLDTHKKIIVTCEFCNHPYDFDAIDVARVMMVGAHVSSDKRQ